MTNNGNNKTMLMRYGGANTQFYSAGASSVAAAAFQGLISNRGAIGSQIMNGTGTATSYSSALTAFATASEDSDAAQNIQFVGTLANSGDTLTLERYLVELVG